MRDIYESQQPSEEANRLNYLSPLDQEFHIACAAFEVPRHVRINTPLNETCIGPRCSQPALPTNVICTQAFRVQSSQSTVKSSVIRVVVSQKLENDRSKPRVTLKSPQSAPRLGSGADADRNLRSSRPHRGCRTLSRRSIAPLGISLAPRLQASASWHAPPADGHSTMRFSYLPMVLGMLIFENAPPPPQSSWLGSDGPPAWGAGQGFPPSPPASSSVCTSRLVLVFCLT